jgi:hypothetical protein
MTNLNDFNIDDILADLEAEWAAESTGEIIEEVIAFDYKSAMMNFPPLFIMDKKVVENGLRTTDLQARTTAFNAQVMPRTTINETEFNALLDTLMDMVLNPTPMFYTKSYNRFEIENGTAKKYKIPADQVQILANTFRNTLLNIDC